MKSDYEQGYDVAAAKIAHKVTDIRTEYDLCYERMVDLEAALKKAAGILEIWECEGTLGEGGEELAKIVRAALGKGESCV